MACGCFVWCGWFVFGVGCLFCFIVWIVVGGFCLVVWVVVCGLGWFGLSWVGLFVSCFVVRAGFLFLVLLHVVGVGCFCWLGILLVCWIFWWLFVFISLLLVVVIALGL